MKVMWKNYVNIKNSMVLRLCFVIQTDAEKDMLIFEEKMEILMREQAD